MRRRSTAHGIWPPRRSCATQIGAAHPGFWEHWAQTGEGRLCCHGAKGTAPWHDHIPNAREGEKIKETRLWEEL